MLTNTVESIVVQLVAYVTAAVEATDGVIASLFTASIACITFIDIYITYTHRSRPVKYLRFSFVTSIQINFIVITTYLHS